jgi:DNA polymerase-3 subunit gamma/tau
VSDTVLARKWRPKNFSELVGQEHVMQALANALDQQRLHHAYLFTGTRGVGKTTIARIFSKALNCEQGISSKPCGVCSTCRSIDEGRFVDLIEVDAASKTKVEDTRELLENVQYAPVQGRYKVYLIDEVHMLSKSSFNALLKTLEEPPEHVKFLLATTDPHKLPMTVLSRCLQFNLMRLTQTQIQTHLGHILQQEGITFEDAALAMIAKSADGSARDSLSILDQAIAYGGGQVQLAAVQAMLGLVDQQFTLQILAALADESADALKNVIQQLAAMGVDYTALNAQLIEVLHQITLLQVLGTLDDGCVLDDETMQVLAETLSPERVQVLYQIALLAKQDMSMAPDIRIGFEMALLRMLAFQPMAPGAGGLSSGGETVQAPANTNSGEASVMAKITRPGDVLKQQGLKDVAEPEPAEPSQTAEPAQSVASPTNDVMDSGPMATAEPAPESIATPALNQAVSEPVPDAPVDHLADLKARLDLTLGKPETIRSAAESAAPEEASIQPPVANPDAETTLNPAMETPSEAPVAQVSAPSAPLPWEEDNSMSDDALNAAPTDSTNAALQDESPWPKSTVEEALGTESIPPTFEDAPQTVSMEREVRQEPAWEAAASEPAASETERVMAEVASAEPEYRPNDAVSSPTVTVSTGDAGEWRDADKWLQMIVQLQLDGMAAELARQSILVSQDTQTLTLSVDPQQMHAKTELALQRLEEQIKAQLGCRLVFVQADQAHLTPARYETEMKAQRQANAVNSIQSDPQVQSLIQTLNLKVIESSIRPVKH